MSPFLDSFLSSCFLFAPSAYRHCCYAAPYCTPSICLSPWEKVKLCSVASSDSFSLKPTGKTKKHSCQQMEDPKYIFLLNKKNKRATSAALSLSVRERSPPWLTFAAPEAADPRSARCSTSPGSPLSFFSGWFGGVALLFLGGLVF